MQMYYFVTYSRNRRFQLQTTRSGDWVQTLFFIDNNGAFPLHGTARYGSLLGGFPLGTVPGTF